MPTEQAEIGTKYSNLRQGGQAAHCRCGACCGFLCTADGSHPEVEINRPFWQRSENRLRIIRSTQIFLLQAHCGNPELNKSTKGNCVLSLSRWYCIFTVSYFGFRFPKRQFFGIRVLVHCPNIGRHSGSYPLLWPIVLYRRTRRHPVDCPEVRPNNFAHSTGR